MNEERISDYIVSITIGTTIGNGVIVGKYHNFWQFAAGRYHSKDNHALLRALFRQANESMISYVLVLNLSLLSFLLTIVSTFSSVRHCQRFSSEV